MPSSESAIGSHYPNLYPISDTGPCRLAVVRVRVRVRLGLGLWLGSGLGLGLKYVVRIFGILLIQS